MTKERSGAAEYTPLPLRGFRGERGVVLIRSTSATSGLGESDLIEEVRPEPDFDERVLGESTSSPEGNNDERSFLGTLSAPGEQPEESRGWD